SSQQAEHSDTPTQSGAHAAEPHAEAEAGTAETVPTQPAEAEPERDVAEVDVTEFEPAESNRRDMREVAAEEPALADEDTVRVPSSDETAESVQRAQRALAEIAEREAAEREREAE